MKPDNVTCVQRVRFFFYFYEKREWLKGETPPLNKLLKEKKVVPQAIRELREFLNIRLDRIATMMDTLLNAHNNWAITGKADKIIMETQTFDFNEALKVLKDNGFNDDEYILEVEYDRKWGLL